MCAEYGVGDESKLKVVAKTCAKGNKGQSIIVTGAHQGCGGCANAVTRVVEKTPCAVARTAKRHSFTYNGTGNFNNKKFFGQ